MRNAIQLLGVVLALQGISGAIDHLFAGLVAGLVAAGAITVPRRGRG